MIIFIKMTYSEKFITDFENEEKKIKDSEIEAEKKLSMFIDFKHV